MSKTQTLYVVANIIMVICTWVTQIKKAIWLRIPCCVCWNQQNKSVAHPGMYSVSKYLTPTAEYSTFLPPLPEMVTPVAVFISTIT